MLQTLLAFALALGLLITFHELGHYWVARRCGVKVLRFSVGFGPVLLRRHDRNGTEWALSAIPLGGYVKMLDDAPEHAPPALAAQAFNQQPLSRRAAIVAAGPAANLLLAALLYAVLNFMGTREPAAVIAAPPAGTPAAQAGLQAGDRLVSVGRHDIASWSQARWRLLDVLTTGGEIRLGVESGSGVPREVTLRLPEQRMATEDVDLMAQAGLSLTPAVPRVESVDGEGAGAQAGLQPGDRILAAGERSRPTVRELIAEVQAHPGQPLKLSVRREGATLDLTATPRAEAGADGQAMGRLGVALAPDLPLVMLRHGVLDSLWGGVTRTVDTAWLSVKMMGRMLTGHVSPRQISGPVTIADYAGQTARIGVAAYLSFLALISVSIGVLNLLPIPLLDGGHLMFYAMEAVRGRPVPEHWQAAGQRIGLLLLAGLMSLAFFNDFTRLFS